MKTDVEIRFATTEDSARIAEIYNQGIADRAATLETEPRTDSDRRNWLESRSARTPVLVAELNGSVCGWGSLNQFSSRPAYRHVADFSIYIDRDARGRGIGGKLLSALIETARSLDYHKLVLSAFPWNEAGMALYERAGFREVGRYHEQGVLDGQWVDTVIMELLLDNQPPLHAEEARPPLG